MVTYKRGNKKYRRVLLRDTYREDGKIKHNNTLGNISSCSEDEIETIKIALRNKGNFAYLKQLIKENRPAGSM